MHLLYVDESGTPSFGDNSYFVLAGISVFERMTHWVEKDLNAIAERFAPDDPYRFEFHGSPMLAGRDEWRAVQKEQREQALLDSLEILRKHQGKIRIFAAVLTKGNSQGDDVIRVCFEQIASRFDMYLSRLYARNDPQRGIIIFDEQRKHEKSIQNLARNFKNTGHSYGKLRNFSEVPLFLDSKASRLIQMADMVSFAIFRKYERNDAKFFNIIQNCFDFDAGSCHGLFVR